MLMPLWVEQLWARGEAGSPGGFDAEAAERLLDRFRAHRVKLVRPVLVLSGWRAVAVLPANVIANLSPMFEDAAAGFLGFSFPTQTSFPRIARRLVERVQARWPNAEPERTVEVDAIAVSMGGLVSRFAASQRMMDGERRLAIKRLFTLGTPHRGAWLADRIAIDAAAREMKSGSRLLAMLDAELERAEYELVCYARLRDEFVGAQRTAPPGRNPIWLSGPRMLSHLTIAQDRRILADIAARLRDGRGAGDGETSEPPLMRGDERGPPPRD